MKIEEAIEYMQDGVNAIHNECDTMLNNNSEIDDAFELIKEACGKQIPKKPIPLVTFDGDIDLCNECESVLFPDANYCHECGTKVSWEEL